MLSFLTKLMIDRSCCVEAFEAEQVEMKLLKEAGEVDGGLDEAVFS